MKFLKALVPVILIAALLCSCSAKQTTTSDAKGDDPCNTVASQEQIEQDKKAIAELINKIDEAYEFQYHFYDLECPDSVELFPAVNPYYPNAQYYKAVGYNSIEEVKQTALKYFSKKAAYDKFFKYFEDPKEFENGAPYLIELGDNLYVEGRFDMGDKCIFKKDSLKITELSADKATVEIMVTVTMDMENFWSQSLSLVKEDGRWLFDELI